MLHLSVRFFAIRGVEHPVSKSACTVIRELVPQWRTIGTIGRLPQSGFSVDFSGGVGPASFLHCLSCDVPAIGSSGPFRLREVPQMRLVRGVPGCSDAGPFKNPTEGSSPKLADPSCPSLPPVLLRFWLVFARRFSPGLHPPIRAFVCVRRRLRSEPLLFFYRGVTLLEPPWLACW
jgi:hypothetical protein